MSNHTNIKAINAARASKHQEQIKASGRIHMPISCGRKLGGNRATKARRINGFIAMRTVRVQIEVKTGRSPLAWP